MLVANFFGRHLGAIKDNFLSPFGSAKKTILPIAIFLRVVFSILFKRSRASFPFFRMKIQEAVTSTGFSNYQIALV